MGSWANMLHDDRLTREVTHTDFPLSLREHVEMWFTYYWWPTRRWMPKVSLWWAYHVRRYPKPPPLHEDPVFQRLFAEVPQEDPQ